MDTSFTETSNTAAEIPGELMESSLEQRTGENGETLQMNSGMKF